MGLTRLRFNKPVRSISLGWWAGGAETISSPPPARSLFGGRSCGLINFKTVIIVLSPYNNNGLLSCDTDNRVYSAGYGART